KRKLSTGEQPINRLPPVIHQDGPILRRASGRYNTLKFRVNSRSEASMQVWIGTSGYSYREWVGGFYPVGTTPRRMLPFYCGHFPIVELNFTFYQTPTPDMLAHMAEQTPDGFQF